MRKSALFGSVSLIASLTTFSPAALAQTPVEVPPLDEDAPTEEVRTVEREGVADIVVTAQRREESLQDVPIAISAFDEDELARRGIREALEIAAFVPNLVGLNNTGIGSANTYFLRGLGSTETIATFDPAVGTYIDDIYLSRQNANNLNFFDIERVEVLRGPQGTLFGRNTTGGAISVVFREPGDFFGGYVDVGYGSYERYVGRASIDVPIREGFAIKLSGFVEDDEGYVENLTTGETLNDSDGWGARLGVRGELSPSVRWTGSYMHLVANGENVLNFDCNSDHPLPIANRPDCDGRFATTGLREGDRDPDGPFVGILSGEKQFFLQGNRTATDIVASDFQVALGDFTLNFITGFVNLNQEFALDFADGRTFPSIANPFPPVLGFTRGGFSIINDGQHEQFTQEVKLIGSLFEGVVDFVTGIYFFREDNRTNFGDVFSLNLPFAPAPAGFPLLLADRVLFNDTEAYAAYAQADVTLIDDLTFTAGIRFTDETKTLDIRDNRPQVGVSPTGQPLCRGPNQFGPSPCLINQNLVAATGVPIPTEQNVDIFTPRFVLTYEPRETLLLFASATRGFKSGGWNARATSPSTLLPFGPETVWSYELGVKADVLRRLLRVNLVGYWAEVEDLQTPAALIGPTGAATFLVRNFADYRNRGLELELNSRPWRDLNLFAAIGYQDDEYKLQEDAPEFDEFGVRSVAAQLAQCQAQLAAGLIPGGDATACGVGIVAPDGTLAEPVRTPEWTIAGGASYDLDLGNGMRLVPAVNASYRSAAELSTTNLSIFTGPITSSTGRTFPANPFSGDFISGSFSDAYVLVNANVVLWGNADRWSVGVECSNCFDVTTRQSALVNYTYLGRPRTWLARARFNF